MNKETKNIKLSEAYRNGQTIQEALKIVLSLSELSYADSESDSHDENTKESRILRRLIINSRNINEDIMQLTERIHE